MADPQDNNPIRTEHGETDPTSLPPLSTAPTTAPDDASMDPGELDAANQSLADSLAVSFKVLRWLMLVILVIFILSGFFTVQSNEVAVRTRFGKVIPGPDGGDVLTAEGGPYFRWPAPVGNVYRVPVTDQTLRIDEAFVYEAAKGRMASVRLSEVGSNDENLDPQADGSLLTGDGNLVHARYSVTYRVRPEQAAQFLANVVSGQTLAAAESNPSAVFRDAEEVVRAAVESAIVADVAGKTFDEFYGLRAAAAPATTPPPTTPEPGTEAGAVDPATDTPEGEAPVEPAPDASAPPAEGDEAATEAVRQQDRVRVAAQATLDELEAGITVQNVQLTERSVPPILRNMFDAAFQAEQLANASTSRARRDAEEVYLSVADRAYPAVLALVRAYEELERVREQRPEQFQAAQEAMNAVFDGQPVGPPLLQVAEVLPEGDERIAELERLATQFGNETIGGQAGTTVATAQNRITQELQELEADARRFEGLLGEYQARPQLVKQRLYLSMLSTVLGNPAAIKETVPAGLRNLRVLLNEDQDIRRQIEQERRQQQRARPPQQ